MRKTLVTTAAWSVLTLTSTCAIADPICGDVNVSLDVTTSDALAVLKKAVGQSIQLQCEQCPAGTTYGNTTDFVTPDEFYSGYLQGAVYAIPVASTVTHLGVIAKSSGQHARLALYTDDAGEPGELVVGTSVFTLAEGAQQIQVPATFIPAGSYWIMSVYDATVLIGTDRWSPVLGWV